MTPRQFAKRLEHLANSTEELCEKLGKRSLQLVNQGFNRHLDPNNKNWAKRKENPKPWYPIHQDTRDLQRSFRLIGWNKNGFTISSDSEYAAIRNFGIEGQEWPKARAMLPGTNESLPERFAEPLQSLARWFIQSKLGVNDQGEPRESEA
jgi:phage gpG-like protein